MHDRIFTSFRTLGEPILAIAITLGGTAAGVVGSWSWPQFLAIATTVVGALWWLIRLIWREADGRARRDAESRKTADALAALVASLSLHTANETERRRSLYKRLDERDRRMDSRIDSLTERVRANEVKHEAR